MATRGICSIPDCNKFAAVRGWCHGHYRRWLVHGSTDGGGTANGEPEKFFADALSSNTDECVLWPFSKEKKGYARILHEGRFIVASRMMCEKVNGAPPSEEYHAAHSCGVCSCINPKHLSWKTASDNAKDKEAHGTRQFGAIHYAAKLSEASVREIRAIGRSRPLDEVATMFHVSRTAVRKVLDRKTWTHI